MANYARMVLLKIDPVNPYFPKVYITVQKKFYSNGMSYLMYILPGGIMEIGEDVIDTLIREQREEGNFPYDFWSLVIRSNYQFIVNWQRATSLTEFTLNKDIVLVYAELGKIGINSNKDPDTIYSDFIDLHDLIENQDSSSILLPDNVVDTLVEVRKNYWADFVLEELSKEFYLGKEPMYPWQEIRK